MAEQHQNKPYQYCREDSLGREIGDAVLEALVKGLGDAICYVLKRKI